VSQELKESPELNKENHKAKNDKTVKIVFYALMCNIFIMVAVFWNYIFPPTPDYFSTSINGKTEKLVALNEPNTSDHVIIQWATLATIASYSYDFVNYENQLEKASQFFTPDAWNAFINALEDGNTLDSVISKKLVVNAVATKSAVILEKGVLNGTYSWKIQIPILVTYQSARELTPVNLVVTLLVNRMSTRFSVKGIGIRSFVADTLTETAGIDI
jgi:intracellular multiplication protein IcmL